MKAFVIKTPFAGGVQTIAEPKINENEVLIKVISSGICGTDTHIFEGSFPCSYPIVPGHEVSGKVISVGKNCRRIKAGDNVAIEPNIPCNNCYFCLNNQHHYCQNMEIPGVNKNGGMAQFICVNERGVFSIDDLSYELGAMMEPLSCVLHSHQRASIKQGEKILVFGAGPIGVMHAIVAKRCGATQIDFVEKNKQRQNIIKAYNFGKVWTDLKMLQREYSLVIEAAGVSFGLNELIKLLKPQGRLLIFGVPHVGKNIKIDHFYVFKEEIQIIGSYTSLKDNYRTIDFIKNERKTLSTLITHKIPLEDFESVLEKKNTFQKAMKIIVNIEH